jgi:hypothetical protein
MRNGTIVNAPDTEQWRHFVAEHPKGSVFHTPEMFEVFRHAKRHRPCVLAALDPTGSILALLVSVRVQTLPDPLGMLSSRAILYAEPLCRSDEPGIAALRELLREHDAQMGRDTLFAEVRPLRAAGAERMALEAAGYRYADYLNYVADLTCPLDELWKKASRQCKGNIRHGTREGVMIRETTDEKDLDEVYALLQASYEHAGVPMADKSLFKAASGTLLPRGMLKVNVAYHCDTPIGADLLLTYRDYVFDWYRGLERIKSLYPGECLVWHQLEWAKEHGFAIYDFAGAGYPNVPYGVREFKAKFGGTLVTYGRYRRVYAAYRLELAERVYQWRRAQRTTRFERQTAR